MNSSNASHENVLITGASSGIGFHLARQFAQHGHRLYLVAPESGSLENAADTIAREFDVTATPLAKDLTDAAAIDELCDQLSADGVNIDILVNNAGLGQRGKFW